MYSTMVRRRAMACEAGEMVGGEFGFESLQARGFELFAFEAGEQRGEELQIFEGVLGGVKDRSGALA